MHSDLRVHDVQYETDKTHELVQAQVSVILDELKRCKFPIPSMSSSPHGGVYMYWRSKAIDIALEIKTGGEMEFTSAQRTFTREGEVSTTEVTEGILSSPKGVDQLMVWYFADQTQPA